ncbi:hypothetical protein KAR28_06745, partial [Candidatus Parcubacteria bacterium]|nr:hypothetical protein [Candidatus Parcubacteria bacterium]
MASKITEITRRDILDAIFLEGINLYGRLEETEFLSRIWDLNSMPSTDGRRLDGGRSLIWHTVNNDDWESGWVFSDSRFNLMRG